MPRSSRVRHKSSRESILLFGTITLLAALFGLWGAVRCLVAARAAARYNAAPECLVLPGRSGRALVCQEETVHVLDAWTSFNANAGYAYYVRLQTTRAPETVQLAGDWISNTPPSWWSRAKNLDTVSLQWFDDRVTRITAQGELARTVDNPNAQVEQGRLMMIIGGIAILPFGSLTLINIRSK